MKILHVIPTLARSSGGPVQSVIQLCQELKKQGTDVAIVTTTLEETTNTANSLPKYYFPTQFSSFLPSRFAFSCPLGKWLGQYIRNFDLVHIHYLFSYPSTIAAHYAHKYKIPYIIRPAGMLSEFCLNKNAFKKELYIRFFERRNLKNASAIQFTSQMEMDEVKRLNLNNRYILIPNGLALEKFKNIESLKGLFRQHYPQTKGKKIILFLSRLDPVKGLDLLIPALKILSKKRNDFIFVLAGGDSKGYLRKIKLSLSESGLEGLTIFTGFVENELKIALLADSDVFILPSYHENFGLAIIEAMAADLAVITTNRVGIYKLIEAFGAGIISGLNSQDIAKAIEGLLSDDALRFKLGAQGRRLVKENFDIQKITQDLRQVYSDLANK